MEGGDALELQPLHGSTTDAATLSTAAAPQHLLPPEGGHHGGAAGGYYSTSTTDTGQQPQRGSLEMILGLDEPLRSTKHSSTHYDSTTITEDDEPFLLSSSRWDDWWYPADRPAAVQVWRRENLAIPASYLVVGVLQGMLRPVLNVYPLDLGATEAQQTTLASIATLPSALKILFGFLSDNVPIAGRRRKPYMWMGWMTVSCAMAALLYTSDLSLSASPMDVSVQHQLEQQGDEATDAVSSYYTALRNPSGSTSGKPSMEWLMLVFFLTGCGMWLADVMADSLVAQKVVLEPTHLQGNLQATCYTCRFFGLMVAAPISTYLYSRSSLDDGTNSSSSGPATAVWVIMITPLLLLPLVYLLAEEKNVPVPSTAHQCREIWTTICSRSVWQPVGYLYLFNLLHLPNAAWRQYLKSVLGFTAAQLNALLVTAYVMLYLGTVTYKYLFLHSSWRRLYQACILLNCVFSGSQLLLIRGQTFGLSPFLFSLGDEVLQEFIVGIQFLPVSILMVTLCPTGSEGASYAMFTTTWNSAMMLAPAISSSFLLGIWDVRKETMESGDLDGLFNLTILTTLLQVSPILFLGWLPHGREDLHALSSSSSKVGGAVFLFVVLAGLCYTVAVALLNVLRPGWAGQD